MSVMASISLDEIRAAAERIAGTIVRTPLLRMRVDPAPCEIYLKLENLQPIGSFKIRGAANRMLSAFERGPIRHVWTASAGNMAQGVAWCARQLGVLCTVVMPETAPATKRSAVTGLGARVIDVTFDEWLDVFESRRYPALEGLHVHAFSDPAVMAGNGTIGLEILEDLPDVDAIVVPYGGGGLSCGIASAVRAVRPGVPVFAAEVETAAPFAASLKAGQPVEVDYVPSFVDGIGAPRVFADMWPMARDLLRGSLVVSPDAAAAAIRQMVTHNHIVAEGAGAVPVAAALAGLAGGGKVACVVSGGNIDLDKLTALLHTA